MPLAAGSAAIRPLPGDTGAPGSDVMALQAEALAPFASLNDVLNQRVTGHTYAIDTGHTVTVKSAQVFGYGDAIGIRVDFAAKTSSGLFGKLSGRLYLTGKPTYDQTRRILSVEDLQSDANTSNLLVNAAAFLAQPILRTKLQSALAFDVSKQVDPLTTKVLSGLQNYKIRDGVTANLRVTDLTASNIGISRDAVWMLFAAKGRANVEVNPAALAAAGK